MMTKATYEGDSLCVMPVMMKEERETKMDALCDDWVRDVSTVVRDCGVAAVLCCGE